MKTLRDYETRPMTNDESELLIRLMMIPRIPKSEVLEISMCNLINKRLPEGFEVDGKLLLLVGDLTKGSPGNGVMWAFTLYKNNVKNVDELVNVFPNGFPTDEAYHACWKNQKDGGTNILDRPETWE